MSRLRSGTLPKKGNHPLSRVDSNLFKLDDVFDSVRLGAIIISNDYALVNEKMIRVDDAVKGRSLVRTAIRVAEVTVCPCNLLFISIVPILSGSVRNVLIGSNLPPNLVPRITSG